MARRTRCREFADNAPKRLGSGYHQLVHGGASPINVVIPTRNRSSMLAQAIESVLRSPLLKSPADLIVVDDGSTDTTPSIAALHGVTYLRVTCGGASCSRNAGLARARHEFVAFLDDDDAWLPGNMEPQLAALRAHPDAAFAYGRIQRTDPDLAPFGEPFPPLPLRSGRALDFILLTNQQLGAVLFRRQVLTLEHGFDELVRFVEDSELLVRVAARHPVVGVDFVGCLWRQRPASVDGPQARWNVLQAYLWTLERWRAKGVPIPLKLRIAAERGVRGRVSYLLCQDAATALDNGDLPAAQRTLQMAFGASPLHAVVSRPFWRTASRLVRRRAESRRRRGS